MSIKSYSGRAFAPSLSDMTVTDRSTRHKAVWGPKRTLAAAALALVTFAPNAMAAGRHHRKLPTVKSGANWQSHRGVLDGALTTRSKTTGTSRVIISLKPGATLPPDLQRLISVTHNRLNILNASVVTISNNLLKKFASNGAVFQIDEDRPIGGANFRTALTTGAAAVQHTYGLTGAGVGVAVIDSGITSWHDDFTNRTSATYPYGNQRVSAFVNFVDGNPNPHDDFGHGTHVAGILAGNGYDSLGQKAGIAPDASLAVLKVLDSQGNGTISNIIAAFDWVLQNHTAYNIRVVNASIGAPITESYLTDPLTLAAKRLVDAGVVVVAAAGNMGKNAAGQIQYGAISAPGNAPWVITVGASSTMGTPNRVDDTIATFSSRGPTYLDYSAKPDLVAPGAGTISAASPGSTLVSLNVASLVGGVLGNATPYLTLSGTSMATPVVAGTVALMLQANPSLTPNMVKAILEYTAQSYAGYDTLTQGAGFLNTLGAVRLAKFFATATPGTPMPSDPLWGKQLLWGNHLVSGGVILPSANAFQVGTAWGVTQLSANENVVWGTSMADQNVVWGTSSDENVVWGTSMSDENVVWGTDCGGADCDTVVWGSSDPDGNVVWGTAAADENVVWGTSASDENVVWGTSAADENVVWGTSSDENVVRGTSANFSVSWGGLGTGGSSTLGSSSTLVWGLDSNGNIVWGTSTFGVKTWYGATGSVTTLNWNALTNMSDGQVFHLFNLMTTNAPSGSGGF